MAIYQFYLALVPRKGLLAMHGRIPDAVAVSTATGYFESNTQPYWLASAVSPAPILARVDALVTHADWSKPPLVYCWKTKGEDIDNDAALETDGASGCVDEFSFRADMRGHDRYAFLHAMLALARGLDCLLMDRKGRLCEPDPQAVVAIFGLSDTHRFLSDPMGFLVGLDKGGH